MGRESIFFEVSRDSQETKKLIKNDPSPNNETPQIMSDHVPLDSWLLFWKKPAIVYVFLNI